MRTGQAPERTISRGPYMNFEDLRSDYDIVPVVRELSADTITPVAAFTALAGSGDAFLFESVERGENVGRYSFVGFDPRRRLRFERDAQNPAVVLNDELRPLRIYNEEKLPPFFGGPSAPSGSAGGGGWEGIPAPQAHNFGIPQAHSPSSTNALRFAPVGRPPYPSPAPFPPD